MSETSTRRILTKRGEAIVPLIPNPPLLTSGGAWRGLILEKHLAGRDYLRRNFESHSTLVHFFTGLAMQEWRVDGRTHAAQNAPGSVSIEPRGLYASVVRVIRPGRKSGGYSRSPLILQRNPWRGNVSNPHSS